MENISIQYSMNLRSWLFKPLLVEIRLEFTVLRTFIFWGAFDLQQLDKKKIQDDFICFHHIRSKIRCERNITFTEQHRRSNERARGTTTGYRLTYSLKTIFNWYYSNNYHVNSKHERMCTRCAWIFQFRFVSFISFSVECRHTYKRKKKNIYLYCWGSLLGENKNQNKFTTRDTENIQCVDISHIEFPFQ